MHQVMFQILWEFADIVSPIIFSAGLFEGLEHSLKHQVQFIPGFLIVHNGWAEVWEFFYYGLGVFAYGVAEALVCLELFVIVAVSLQVPQAHAPLLGYLVQVLGYFLRVDESKTAESDSDVLSKRLVELLALQYLGEFDYYLLSKRLNDRWVLRTHCHFSQAPACVIAHSELILSRINYWIIVK